MNKSFIQLARKTFSNSTSGKKNVTFIGLGNMGYSMASNLLKSGKYSISAFDLNKEVAEQFNKQENASNIPFSTSVNQADFIMTVLPSTDNVKSTINEIKNSLTNNNKQREIQLIDSSTICPISTRSIAEDFSKFGKSLNKNNTFNFTDAPISGGVVGAKNATLTFMVGANSEESFLKIKEFLSPMGKNFFNCGNIGNGQVAKICNNLVLGITTAGLSESISLGKKLGIDEKVLASIMSVSSAYCWSLNVNSPVPGVVENAASSRNYEKGFNVDLMKKDMNLGKDAANAVKANTELADISAKYYEDISKQGKGKLDFSYVYQYLVNNKKV